MSDRIFKYEPLWGEWSVESLVGEGTFGKVYRLSKMQNGEKAFSVAKIIHVPILEADSLRFSDAGLSDAQIREMFSSAVSKLARDVERFTSRRPMANIVNYLDASIETDADGGWDILLHMEELTPLTALLDGNKLTVRDVVRIGQEISNALAQLSRVHVVHADVKPENIFMTRFGSFKLADIGIASNLRSVCPAAEDRVSRLYMAPEVDRGQPYDASCDIYSLGVLLYRLLNKNRLPLMDPQPGDLGAQDVNDAVEKRLAGAEIAELPLPVSRSIAAAVSSMIRYAQQSRVADAAQLKQSFDDLYLFETDLDSQCETAQGSALYKAARPPLKEEGEAMAYAAAAALPEEGSAQMPISSASPDAETPHAEEENA
ncbi:MAG: protein kinase, partial [Eubacteriaceae bacterium]|nr:protein kinase [Eubacteriaceae bacterium]